MITPDNNPSIKPFFFDTIPLINPNNKKHTAPIQKEIMA